MLDAGLKQVLNKIRWKSLPNGGMIREYLHEEEGPSLLRLATLEEIKPNEKYYMIDPIKSNYFYETSFGSEVSWDTITEFVNTKKIYIRDERKNQNSPSKPPPHRDKGSMQSALF